jgi:hypothetical protein
LTNPADVGGERAIQFIPAINERDDKSGIGQEEQKPEWQGALPNHPLIANVEEWTYPWEAYSEIAKAEATSANETPLC